VYHSGIFVAGALYLPSRWWLFLFIGGAIQASRDATRGDLFMFVLFAVVVSIIAQAGSYLCYVESTRLDNYYTDCRMAGAVFITFPNA
jgi:hypothetical protein